MKTSIWVKNTLKIGLCFYLYLLQNNMLSQIQRSWISSPLGSNILLALFKNNNANNNYVQLETLLINKKEFKSKTKVYYSNIIDVKNKLHIPENVKTLNLKNFKEDNKEVLWMNKKKIINDFVQNILTFETKLVLSNISTYEDKWNKHGNCEGAIMKVYNSFNYTEDIKYEARLIELPMRDNDFKLVIIVPNEVDVLNNLVKKLTVEGFSAATVSIQPAFTSICTLNAPYIKFDSILEETQKIDNDVTITKAEVGSVKIDNSGVSINVFTCIFPTSIQTEVTKKLKNISENPFHFCLVFKDTSIYNGKYIDVKELK